MAGSGKKPRLVSHYVPAEVDKPGRQKLLVVLHGLGDSIEGYRFLPQELELPSLNYLLVNAPDSYFTGFSWFDIYGEMAPGIIRSRQMLRDTLQELESQWAPEDIAVLGFSQGCLMALDIACRYPKVLGGIVGISGFAAFIEQYPEQLSPVALQQKILVTHGTEDPLVPIAATKKQIQALKGMGLAIEWKEYTKAHTIDMNREIVDIRNFLKRVLQLEPKA